MNRTSPSLPPLSVTASAPLATPLEIVEQVGRALVRGELLSSELRRYLRARDRPWLEAAAERARPLVAQLGRASAFTKPDLERRIAAIETGLLRAALAIGCESVGIRDCCGVA